MDQHPSKTGTLSGVKEAKKKNQIMQIVFCNREVEMNLFFLVTKSIFGGRAYMVQSQGGQEKKIKSCKQFSATERLK